MEEAVNVRAFRRTAYVSAASRGIGLAIARQLAQDGCDLVLSSRDQGRISSAAASLQEECPEVAVLPLWGDLSIRADQERIWEEMKVRERFPDIFICNCGQPEDIRLGDLTREQWDHDLEMILGQAVFACQRFAPVMAERGFGRIIFISSTYAKTPSRDFITSSIARASLFALSKILVDEYTRAGVASFVICLGFVDTPLLRNMALGRAVDAPESQFGPATTLPWQTTYDKWSTTIPAQKIGSQDELSAVVSFLCSEKSCYLSGSSLSFAGGFDRGIL